MQMTPTAAIELLFGKSPPEEPNFLLNQLHEITRPRYHLSVWQGQLGNPVWLTWIIYRAEPVHAPFHGVLLSGDGCWPHVINESSIDRVIQHRLSLVWFDRLQFASDSSSGKREGPVYSKWPYLNSSALIVWAWSIQQTITIVKSLNPTTPIGVIGHSRGGKAALLAGALDHRVDVTVANNSGCLGATSMHVHNSGAESLDQLINRYPHWVSETLLNPQARLNLKLLDLAPLWISSIAPRSLCVLQAEDDLWANPEGTKHLVESVLNNWTDKPQNLSLITRKGGHAMTEEDWSQAATFVSERCP